MPLGVDNTWTESWNWNRSSQIAGPGVEWGEVVNGMAGNKQASDLWLACNNFRSHSSLLSDGPMKPCDFSCPKLWSLPPLFSGVSGLCSDSAFCNTERKYSPCRSWRAWSCPVTFLRDSRVAPPVGQCLWTVASYGVSSFVCNEGELVLSVQVTSSQLELSVPGLE